MNNKTCALSLLLLFSLIPAWPASAAEADFGPLLARLPADSDAVLLVDAAEAGRVLQSFMDKIQNTAVVAENPDLKNLFGMQRAMMDSAVGTLRSQMGVDPFKDVHRAALALTLADPARPGLVAVVAGKWPDDFLARAMAREAAPAEAQDGGIVVYPVERDLVMWQQGGQIVVASERYRAAAQAGQGASDALLARHPSLGLALPKGFLLRSSVVVPGYVGALAGQEEMRVLSTLLGGLVRLEAEVGESISHTVHCKDAGSAERARLLLDGWSEILLGGAHLWRAYAPFFLGIDFGEMADAPPQLKAALGNRAALKKTMDEFFPVPGPRPRVTLSGTSVRFDAPPRMMQGATFIMGIAAAVAIPAFIKYLQRAKQAGSQAQAQAIRVALETYRVENGKYPPTEGGLDLLVQQKFLRQPPLDGFGHKFVYESDGETFTLKSFGADGLPGGWDADADVIVRP